jgi:acyl carrier protein phosphodiesterase
MNFLAHLYLSGDSDQILLGNFIADFVNGEEAESYRKEVYLGILLHREIDQFTDRHRLVALSKKKLWHKHRHYSRVIVDVFYDHFLAKNWHQYSDTPLKNFPITLIPSSKAL